MGKAVEFLTPVGRLVQGDCFVPQTKKMDGTPILNKDGSPGQKYVVVVAFAKTDPEFAKIKALIEQVSRERFPHLFPNGGPCVNPNFSTKIIDGDGVDQNGRSNASKEGFAGHWILRTSSSYPPKCFASGKYQPHEQLSVVGGVNPIPRGHYVRVAGSVNDNNTANAANAKPGVYVNCNMVEWSSVGDLITSGPDAGTVFGGGAAVGGVAAQIMTAAAGATTYAQYIAAGWTDAQLIASGFMLPPAPVAPPAPIAPPPAPVAPHTAILAGPQMTAAAGATTYAQYMAAGWTDAQLIASGFMLPPAPAASAPAPLPPAGSAPTPPAPATTVAAPPADIKQSKMTAAAGATTYAQYMAAGWTDAQLVQNGLMLA